jgi:membrane-bound ClpP family serine protease
LKSAIITLVIAFLVFEFIEHVVFPLIWFIKDRNKRSDFNVAGMIGKEVEIKQWDNTEGRVLFNGELWRAVGEVPFQAGDKGMIVDVAGLTLKVKPKAASVREK